MRICMLAYTFYETDNRVMRYSEALTRKGHEVDVIGLMLGNQPVEEVINGVKLLRIQSRAMNESSQWTYLQRLMLFCFRAFLCISRRHLQRPYDLVHVHSIPDFLVFSALIPRITGCGVILDIHDLTPELYSSKFRRGESLYQQLLLLQERLSCKFAHHVIIANDLWRTRLLQRSVPPDKCTVIINAPDRSIFYPAKFVPHHNTFRLLYPGALNHHQGLDLAIRAVALVRSTIPELEFTICGLGPEKERLRKLIHELHLEHRVFLLDAQPIQMIAEAMRQVDVGIVPKRSDSFGNEAFSTKILEFMACGVPVLVSDTKVDKYYFNDQVVEFFTSQDEHDLARALLFLVRNQVRRRELVVNGLQFAERNSWTVHEHRYFEVLRAVTGHVERADVEMSVRC